ncbi:hypothetical protein EDB80DRAFT_744565 [Ilyonectria destructans]|nr:hypothetical protein EDB80DRAFT_744565 [Ilyonectria destructans]
MPSIELATVVAALSALQQFHCSQSEASDLATYALLTLGISNLFALPLASLIGKRYAILISLALFIACNIWSGEVSSYSALRNSPTLGGLAGESWRSYLRIPSIFTGLNFFGSILMLPETTHDVVEPSGTSMRNTRVPVQNPTSTTIEDAYSPPVTDWLSRSFSNDYVPLELKNRAHRLVQPLQLLAVPQVLVMVYMFGLTIGWTVIISIILAMMYAQPPLLWNSRSTGLLNVSSLLSLLIRFPFGGYFADLLFIMSMRGGTRDPDPASRLPMILLGALISPVGFLVLGHALRHPGVSGKGIFRPAGLDIVALGRAVACNGRLSVVASSRLPGALGSSRLEMAPAVLVLMLSDTSTWDGFEHAIPWSARFIWGLYFSRPL